MFQYDLSFFTKRYFRKVKKAIRKSLKVKP